MQESFAALRELVERNGDMELLYPVHPNPNVLKPARGILGRHPRIHLVDPLGYGQFVQAMKQAYLIISDSGGFRRKRRHWASRCSS